MAVDAFIKFDGLEGEAHKVANDFDRLGDSFSDLGGAFIKLVDDGSSTDVNFLKADFAAHIKHDVFAIDQGFFKVGDAFIKLVGPLQTFDDAVIKFWDETLKVTPSDSETPSPLDNLKADFAAFASDFKLTGLDFLGTASDIKGSPSESLSFNFNKISFDYKEQSADASNISDVASNISRDLNKLVEISGISDSKVGEAFIKFSLETVVISTAAQNLSTDFQNISTDFAAASDLGLKTFDQVVVKFADDFKILARDLQTADGAFTALGGDIVKLGEALEHPGPVTPPTFKLG